MFDYTNRMIYLLCPMELNPKRSGRKLDEFEAASNSISNSVAESDSIGNVKQSNSEISC